MDFHGWNLDFSAMIHSKKSQIFHHIMPFLAFPAPGVRAKILPPPRLESHGTDPRRSASVAQVSAFLVALRMKGETWRGSARLCPRHAKRVERVDPDLDGETSARHLRNGGGDNPRTFNISTVAAFVIAGAGVRVAKHGNRSISSECGSADILEGLGVNIRLSPEEMARAFARSGSDSCSHPRFIRP